jgi:hypothetical protein
MEWLIDSISVLVHHHATQTAPILHLAIVVVDVQQVTGEVLLRGLVSSKRRTRNSLVKI